jgi:CheY-like chemotaxis protein
MELSEKQRDAIRMIITSGELLCTVVNDILDFSKLESGNVLIETRHTSLQETLDSVVNSIQHKANSKRVRFETIYAPSLPHCIQTDGNRLQQILYNLLGNALKFSDEGGSVELFVDFSGHQGTPEQRTSEAVSASYPTSHSSGVLCFSVKDYGRGIDSKDFFRIFEPFGQANGDTERLYGGTGLGLAITSRLVERLGGEIAVESELGKWSKFTVNLPVSTISLFDQASVAKRLADALILYVDEFSGPNQRIVQDLGVPVEHFSTCRDLFNWFTGEKDSNRISRFYICLIHEDLFSPEIYRKVSGDASAALITFGPQQYRIKEAHAHYRSLSACIPSALLYSLAECRIAAVDATYGRLRSVKQQTLDMVNRIDVLIAEDNIINQKVLCKMLNRVGVERIDVANNGREAVDMAARKEYDVIFMDMQMPVMCGDEACRLILENYRGRERRPKIAFVSAHVSTTFETQAVEAGADGFLSKPFNVKKFEDFMFSLDIDTSLPSST